MHNAHIEFDDIAQLISIFGSYDVHVKAIMQALDVDITARDNAVEIRGENEQAVRTARETIETLKKMLERGEVITDWTVSQAIDLVQNGDAEDAFAAMANVVAVTYRGKPVKCRTAGQKGYIDAIKKNTVTLCIGPAGTGKTYLAMAMAISALKKKEVSRIILTRPAVEAGEKLGFLPGDLQNKVDPYLRPLYDALHEFLGQEQFQRHLEGGVIEVAPLAYMRGRTLNDAIIVVDEAQNASIEQMKMVLTRFGEGAKLIVTGDITQIDLPPERVSGLKRSADILKGIDDIAIVHLTNRDVVRHKLVKEIIKAFDKYDDRGAKPAAKPARKPTRR